MVNYLVICMDACSYRSYVKANTPNFNKIGKARKVYSCAGWTVPGLVSMFTNTPFYNLGSKKLFDNIPFDRDWLFTTLKNMGYYTAIVSSNPWIYHMRDIFSKDADALIGKGWSVVWSADKVCDAIISTYNSIEKPKFIFSLFMDTHFPYGKDVESPHTEYPLSVVKQSDAIESIDREFGRILPHLKDTEITICADHGDVLPSEARIWGHNPARSEFDSRMFAIPFVRGRI